MNTGERHPTEWVPDSLLRTALVQPLTRRLLVSSVGAPHLSAPMFTDRPEGAPFAIVTAHAEGRGWVRIDGKTHAIPAGSICVLPARVPHTYAWDGDPWWRQGWLTLVGSDVNEVLIALGATRDRPVVQTPSQTLILKLVDLTLRRYHSDMSASTLIEVTGLVWRLISQFVADTNRPAQGTPLDRAQAHLGENFASEIRVEDVARAVGLSKSRLQALFHAATGSGVVDYLTALRMGHARRLLDGSDFSIGEVAARVGYSDPYYFSRRFRETHAMSPREYRKRPRP